MSPIRESRCLKFGLIVLWVSHFIIDQLFQKDSHLKTGRCLFRGNDKHKHRISCISWWWAREVLWCPFGPLVDCQSGSNRMATSLGTASWAAHVETQTSQNDRSDQGDWRTRHFFVGGWGGWGGWGWIFCHFCPKNSLKQVDANCHHLWSINYHGHFFGLVSDWKWTTLTAICSAEVPYVMLADLSVLDMSVRSTTLHHRTDMMDTLEGFLRCF